jgi:hypothetical protein
MTDKDLNIYLAENMTNESDWTNIFNAVIEEVNKTPLATLNHIAQLEYLIHKLNQELRMHKGNK